MEMKVEKARNSMKILIAEDDISLREGIAFSLELDGFETVIAGGAKEAIECMKKEPVDFLLLDCNFPDGSGFEVCKKMRMFSDIPVLMLTARDTEMDEIRALETGADDFMSKPFSLAVLKARIRNLLKRKAEATKICSNGVRIFPESGEVYIGADKIALSSVEYKLLLYLMQNKGQILSKEQILEHIWDAKGKFVDDNIVSVNIRRLRVRIEKDAANPRWIQTIHGLGYRWNEEV